jgi:hypothetical protein
MYIIPEDKSGNNVSIFEDTTYYSDLNFLFRFVKDGLLPVLFKDGQDTFDEVLTNYSKPELRRQVFEPIKDEDQKYTSRGETCYINITPNFQTHNRMRMDTLPFAVHTPNNNKFIFVDNLMTMEYSDNVFYYQVELTIKGNDIKVSEFASYIYNRIHVNKYFFLSNNINIKHVINDKIISLYKLFYKHLTEEEFTIRMNEITDGKFYKEIDRATGNEKLFTTLKARPLVRVNSISLNADEKYSASLTISIDLEVSLPCRFYINSSYSKDEITSLIVETVDVIPTADMTDSDKSKAFNFDIAFIKENRDLFPQIDDTKLSQLERGELVLYANSSILSQDDIKFIGDILPGLARIEDIQLVIGHGLEDSVVSNIAEKSNVEQEPNYTTTKIKTIIYNFLTVSRRIKKTSFKLENKQLNIGDELFCTSYKKQIQNPDPNIEYIVKVLINNKVTTDYTIQLEDDQTVSLYFPIDLNGKIVTVEMYKKELNSV